MNEKKQSGPLRHSKGLEMVIWHLLTLSCHNNIKGVNVVHCALGSTIPFNDTWSTCRIKEEIQKECMWYY